MDVLVCGNRCAVLVSMQLCRVCALPVWRDSALHFSPGLGVRLPEVLWGCAGCAVLSQSTAAVLADKGRDHQRLLPAATPWLAAAWDNPSKASKRIGTKCVEGFRHCSNLHGHTLECTAQATATCASKLTAETRPTWQSAGTCSATCWVWWMTRRHSEECSRSYARTGHAFEPESGLAAVHAAVCAATRGHCCAAHCCSGSPAARHVLMHN